MLPFSVLRNGAVQFVHVLAFQRGNLNQVVLRKGGLDAFGFGIFSYLQEFNHESIATNLRNPGYGGVAWGLYVVFVITFTGLSFAGTTTLALTRLLHVNVLKPIARIGELITPALDGPV